VIFRTVELVFMDYNEEYNKMIKYGMFRARRPKVDLGNSKSIIDTEPSMSSGAVNYCIICKDVCVELNLLLNNTYYHTDCLHNLQILQSKYESFCSECEKLLSEIHKLEKINISINNKITTLSNKLLQESKLLKKIVNSCLLKFNIESVLHEKINHHKAEISKNEQSIEKLDSLLNELTDRVYLLRGQSKYNSSGRECWGLLRLQNEKVIPDLEAIYDYWPTYPPDWDYRKAHELFYAEGCDACGERGFIHVHHIKPISKGGSHKHDNLIALCEDCHSLEHGGKEFKYKAYGISTKLNNKIDAIRTAIYDKKNISFHYKKADGEESNRRISPETLFFAGGTVCVSGHCYLRNDKRHFAVKRMTKLLTES